MTQAPGARRPHRIDLRLGAPDERHCVLQVCDNGPGIPADVLPHVFEPFFSTRADGLGLGLSPC
jgi:signal transduction histidine kinase